MNKSDNTFLARWLNGDLTPEEEKDFKNSEDYKAYAKIIKATDKFKAPNYKEEEIFSEIKEKTSNSKKTRKLNIKYGYGVAASLIFLFGLFYFTSNPNTLHETSYGEQLTIDLPDGSEVILNANSVIDYNENDWSENRTITLQGEAYFKVEKGALFKVVTAQGAIEVLGTQFNVNTNTNYLEVKCYTGKVKVTNLKKAESLLTTGKAHRTFNDVTTLWEFNAKEKSWKEGESTFNRTPFLQVITALENQFNIKIKNTAAYKKEIFTGRFSNNNLNLALETIFSAMQINYTLEKNTVKLSNK